MIMVNKDYQLTILIAIATAAETKARKRFIRRQQCRFVRKLIRASTVITETALLNCLL